MLKKNNKTYDITFHTTGSSLHEHMRRVINLYEALWTKVSYIRQYQVDEEPGWMI